MGVIGFRVYRIVWGMYWGDIVILENKEETTL